MSKLSQLSQEPLTQSDVKKFLENYSDFSFELKVLQTFTNLGFDCTHSGLYEDPVTHKSREYDIRALFQKDNLRFNLSVECKNLRENFPLIVHCRERKESEIYNEFLLTFEPRVPTQQVGPISLPLPATFIEHIQNERVYKYSLYHGKQYVAKAIDQIGKHNGEITTNDVEVFDKISQAINSAKDLISDAEYLDTDIYSTYRTFICPVLVIPDNTLWQINYSDNGDVIEEPKKVKRSSYYIGKEWSIFHGSDSFSYTISHLEIVTFSELELFLKEYLGDYFSLTYAIMKRRGEFL